MKKIPVGKTIAESYRFTFLGLERVIGAIWFPVLTLTVARYFVMAPYLAAEAAALDGDTAQLMPAAASMMAFFALWVVMLGVIGVAIVREILAPLNRPLFLRFSLGATEFRVAGAYVGVLLLMIFFIFVVVALALVAGGVLGSVIPATPGLSGPQRTLGVGLLITLCLSPLLLFLMVRLSFLVVPCALTEGKFGIESSWQLTRGNFWRIIAIGLAVIIPLLLVTAIIEIAILGPDYFQHSMGMLADKAAQARHQAEQIRTAAAKLPYLMGLYFIMAPFSYGLTFGASAFAYRALTAER